MRYSLDNMYLKRAFLLSLFLHVGAIILFLSFATLHAEHSKPIRQERLSICLASQQPMPSSAEPQTEPNVTEETKAEKSRPNPSPKPTPSKPKPKPIATVAPIPSVTSSDDSPREEMRSIPIPTATPQEPPVNRAANTQENQIAQKIQAALLAAKTYPKRAQRAGMEGAVALCFTWTSKGVKEAHVCQKSKYTLLDEHSLETLKNAAETFPNVESPVEIRIVLSYTLK